MPTHLKTLIVFVADPAACAAFYERHFGLRPASTATPTYVELDAGGATIGFHQAYGPDGPRNEPTGSERNPHKLVFAVDDVASVHAALRSAGVRALEPGRDGFDAFDIEGHRFSVVRN